MLDEILASINIANDVKIALANHVKNTSFFKFYMQNAVGDNWVSVDPEKIEYKQYSYHRSMAGAMLMNRQTVNILSSVVFVPEVPNRTKAFQMKSLFEMLYVGECDALMAILRKDIASIYPNITFDLINEVLNESK